jgi:hypothetical protein
MSYLLDRDATVPSLSGMQPIQTGAVLPDKCSTLLPDGKSTSTANVREMIKEAVAVAAKG